MTPTVEYIAGFFDGEGCVGLYYDKRDRRWSPEINITQRGDSRTRVLMQHIAQRYDSRLVRLNGGFLNFRIRKTSQMKAFIKDILPFSTVKHTQLLLLDTWLDNRTYSFRTAQMLKTLKRRA